jgi:hypothetical protein
LVRQNPGSQQLPSQITNLGLDIISLLATGQLSATEPRLLMAVRPAGIMPSIEKPSVDKGSSDESETDHTMGMDDDGYDSYDDSDSDFDSDYDSDEDYDFDDGDLNEIIMIGNQRQ